MKQLKVKFALRHNSSATWTNEDPKLLEGEPGIETDTNRIKIGDGQHTWNQLDYFGESATYQGDGRTIEVVQDGEIYRIQLFGINKTTPEDSLPLLKKLDGVSKIQWTPVKDLVVETIDTRTYGDDVSIVTKQGSTNNTLIGSLKDFDKATVNQIPYKTGNGDLAWKNEYKYDDAPLLNKLNALNEKIDNLPPSSVTKGDNITIITVEQNGTLIGSLKGFDAASTLTHNQVPYKKKGTQEFGWKDEYEYDDKPILQRLDALEKIPPGSGGKIDEIKIDGTALTIAADKSVDIPKASANQLGVIKIGNEIGIDQNGVVRVTDLNVNKLTQTEGERLVLQTGGANIDENK